MQCFLFEFWDLQLRDLPEIHPDAPYEFQGWCAHMAQGAKVCFVRGNTGDQLVNGVLPNLAALGAKPTDIMVMNFAVWQNTCVFWLNSAIWQNAYGFRLTSAVWQNTRVVLAPCSFHANRCHPLISAFAFSGATRRRHNCQCQTLPLLAYRHQSTFSCRSWPAVLFKQRNLLLV